MITIGDQLTAVINALICAEDSGAPEEHRAALREASMTLARVETFVLRTPAKTDGKTMEAQF